MGLMRIAGRVNGIKLYQRAIITHEPLDPDERLRRLVLLIASILTPLPESSIWPRLYCAQSRPASEATR